jgi:hypothetical protein
MNKVHGTVVAASGQPAVGANIAFHRMSEGPGDSAVPQATTGADGTFVLTTQTVGDGALAGDYAATVVWPAATAEGDLSGPDRLKGRYADPKRTPFRVSVKQGENSLEPFRLK